MATGKLGALDLSATTNTTVYTCPADTFAVATVSLCNRNATAIAARIAIADTDTPTSAEYIEYDAQVVGKGVLERTGTVLSAGQKLVVYTDTASVSAVVYGIETSTG